MASLKLSDSGRLLIRQARNERGLSYLDLSEMTYLSESTVKRFAAGNAISSDSFKDLCSRLGFSDWSELVAQDEIVLAEDIPSSSSGILNRISSQVQNSASHGIAITGTFSNEQRLQIEAALEALTSLFVTSNVHISS